MFSASQSSWKDVVYFALLDTEWTVRRFIRPAPKNLWDEMFARHERERLELLMWDESKLRLKRTASMETLRAAVPDSPGSSASEMSLGSDKGKGKEVEKLAGSPSFSETQDDPHLWRSPSPGTDSDVISLDSESPIDCDPSDWDILSCEISDFEKCDLNSED